MGLLKKLKKGIGKVVSKVDPVAKIVGGSKKKSSTGASATALASGSASRSASVNGTNTGTLGTRTPVSGTVAMETARKAGSRSGVGRLQKARQFNR